MKIGLFGGTFDPPHLAHLFVAEAIREEFGLDQVWWIPSCDPPHKARGSVSSFGHRLAMVVLATADNPVFLVNGLEGSRSGPSYTVDTVETAIKENPQDTFSLLMGGDSLAQFHTWRDPDRIAALVPLLVFRRGQQPAASLPPFLKGGVWYSTAPQIPLSGTDIRDRIVNNRTIRYLVSDRVESYIRKHGLYRRG